MWQKNIETGELLKGEVLQEGYVLASPEEIEAFQKKEVLEKLGYEVDETTETEITLEYALVLNQRREMISKVEEARNDLIENGKVSVTLASGDIWLVKINAQTRDELVHLLQLIKGTHYKGFFRNWTGEFAQINIGEQEILLYTQNASGVIQNIHSIFRDIGKKIEALQTQDDIDNFPFAQELARLASLREGLGLAVKRTIPKNNPTDEREMQLA